MQILQSYIERNTSFVVQKSVVIQVVFLVAWGSWRPVGLLEHPWAFLNKVFGGGPKEVYADFFGILDATDDGLKRN